MTILQRAEVKAKKLVGTVFTPAPRPYPAPLPAWRRSGPLRCCKFVYHTTHDQLDSIGYFRHVRQRVHSTPRVCAQARKGSSNDAQTFRLSVRLTFGSE